MDRKLSFLGSAIVFILAGLSPGSFYHGAISAADAADVIEEKQDDIKDDMKDVEKKLEKTQESLNKDKQELSQIQGSITQTQREINKTEAEINKTKETIKRKEKEIEFLEKKIQFNREIIRKVIEQMYFSRKSSVALVMESGEGKSAFNGRSGYLGNLEGRLDTAIEEIENSKSIIVKDKEELEDNKKDHEQLLDLKESQQQALVSEKIETQTDIQKKEATVAELQAELSKLKSELSSLLGKAYNFDDITDAAAFAGKVSGVRKDFILGMLVVESNLGRFTGGCAATESRMSSSRLKTFKEICEELDYNWKKQKVSCPPKSYKGTGGAMGVAQFMSDTWLGYKNSIISATGHNPPDPWNLTDGVTAMALKLAKGGATKKSGECNAAKLYLSGSTLSKYNWYCERVLYWADNYEKKF